MGVNFGQYTGYKDLSEKMEKSYDRLINAYTTKIEQDKADDKEAKAEAIAKADKLTTQTGAIHEVNEVTTKADPKKWYDPRTWGNKDTTSYHAEPAEGMYTQSYIAQQEAKTGYIDTNRDGVWGNKGDERTMAGAAVDYQKTRDTKKDDEDYIEQQKQFYRDTGGSGSITDRSGKVIIKDFNPISSQEYLHQKTERDKVTNYEQVSEKFSEKLDNAISSGDTEWFNEMLYGEGFQNFIDKAGLKQISPENKEKLKVMAKNHATNAYKGVELKYMDGSIDIDKMTAADEKILKSMYYIVSDGQNIDPKSFIKNKMDQGFYEDLGYTQEEMKKMNSWTQNARGKFSSKKLGSQSRTFRFKDSTSASGQEQAVNAFVSQIQEGAASMMNSSDIGDMDLQYSHTDGGDRVYKLTEYQNTNRTLKVKHGKDGQAYVYLNGGWTKFNDVIPEIEDWFD